VNASPFRSLSVESSPEVARIAALPRRTWSDAAAADLAVMLTRELKTPNGTMALRPVQAIALYEAMECGGLFGPIRVGGGKTLLTLLLPVVLEAKRPILLLPAALVEKTWRDVQVLKEHWRLPTNVQIVSYELLGLVQSAQKLDYIESDLIVADECFVAGTLIRTASGVRPIESIRVGDYVETGEGLHAVTGAWNRESKDLYDVRIENNQYTCTGSHPFLTTIGWRAARDLAIGAEVVCDVQAKVCSEDESEGRSEECFLGGKRVARVTSVERRSAEALESRARVYNFSVDGPETYVLGGGEIVHNCHYLKNHRAGRTRRVTRYMREHPATRFVGVSGTVMKASVRDFAHILRWALKGNAPIPATDDEVETWADALDKRVNPLARRRPDALLALGGADGEDDVTRARRAFQRRLLDTRGVVASSKTDGVTCSLRVSALEYQPSPVTAAHFTHVRKTMTTPDGWAFSEPVFLRMYLRQLALGFNSTWIPRPPEEWLAARREWAAFVREVLADSDVLDTELQVANAVDAGRLKTSTLGTWRAVRNTFTIQPKDVWHDDAALNACAEWMERERGIVWCEHRFVARRLAQMTGATYYGENGMSESGESITLVKPGKAIIASVQANATGRNLQMFSTNLITSCPPSAQTVEQLVGRTHRDGQAADEVTVDILLGCREHYDSFQRALDGARAAADTLGHDQKLLLSDITIPNIDNRKGPLWA